MSNITEKLKNLFNLDKVKTYFKDNQSSFENLNSFMKKKQNMWGCVVIISMLLLFFVLHELAKSNSHKKPLPVALEKSASVPDGVLSNDFSEKNSLSALETQQQQIDKLNKHVEKLTDEVSNKNGVSTVGANNSLNQNTQLQNNASSFPISPTQLNQSAQSALNTQTANLPINSQLADQAASHPLRTQTFHYGSSDNHLIIGNRQLTTNNSNNYKKDDKTPKTWVPAGTFSKVVLLVGADANASVNGQSDTVPILMRFLDSGTLPNGFHSHLKGCFALASIYGDISSERGEARLNKLSCTKKDGSILEIPVEGFIAFAGKEGIRGIPVMRNGKILTMAGISGALSGVGSALAQGSQTQAISPLGTTTTVTGSQIWQSGAYTGASTAMSQLASYYIKRANQYHPIISIGSGTVSTVVFQTGFSLVPATDSNNSSNSNNTNSSGNSNQNTQSASSNNNASEIKELLQQEQLSAQQKQQNKNNQAQLTDGATDESSAPSPFSSVNQIKMGQSVSNTGDNTASGATNND